MKQKLFTTILILYGSITAAQTDSRQIDLNDYIKVDLFFDSGLQHMRGFNTVAVIDIRDDTSEIGFYSKGSTGKDWPKRYRILPSVEKGISNWINKYSPNDSAVNNVVIVVKKLWLSAEATPDVNETGKQMQANNGMSPGVICKLEFFLENTAAYYPLYRIDSVFLYDEALPNDAGDMLTKALTAATQKLFTLKPDEIIRKRKKLTPAEFNARLTQTRSPMLNAVAYNKGVYRSFEEFKNNSPSLLEYELKKSKMGDMLFTKENNVESPERNAWGFCDGNDIYINSSDKYFKLLKRQNTFYFCGIKSVRRKAAHDIAYTSLFNLATNTGRKHTEFSISLKYYKLDMETGEVY